ncbi:hypothetical protein FOCC_FOCC006503 [Frankliniella occidentalis]|nr:hypothetical protein FOCC_FOCC006503 [Frankliniella occidentalis]
MAHLQATDSQAVVQGDLRTGLDSQVLVGHISEVVDTAWKEDKLPQEDISVPLAELPDPDADNGDWQMTLKKQEERWTDLSLDVLRDQQTQPLQN